TCCIAGSASASSASARASTSIFRRTRACSSAWARRCTRRRARSRSCRRRPTPERASRAPGPRPSRAPRRSRAAVPDERSGEGLAPRRSRRIYLLPNAFTTASLFCGFYAIVQAMNLRYEAAAIAIFIAMVLDSLDGRVARMTNTQSAFGEQYDSLSDMVSFGAAPALVIYEWSLRGLGKWGWLAAFVYCAGAALRLARFNTNIAVVDKRYFQGLPSPAAAALVGGFVWLMNDLGRSEERRVGR